LVPNFAVFHIRRVPNDHIESTRIHNAVELNEPMKRLMRDLPVFEGRVGLEIFLVVLPGEEAVELGAEGFEDAFERFLGGTKLGGGLANVVLKILEAAEGAVGILGLFHDAAEVVEGVFNP
jgi:hypothetical protein